MSGNMIQNMIYDSIWQSIFNLAMKNTVNFLHTAPAYTVSEADHTENKNTPVSRTPVTNYTRVETKTQ